MGEIIRICVVGLVVGLLARFFFPGPVPMGFIGSIVLGLGGSVVGALVPRLLDKSRSREPFAPAGFLGSVLGAMALILVGRLLF